MLFRSTLLLCCWFTACSAPSTLPDAGSAQDSGTVTDGARTATRITTAAPEIKAAYVAALPNGNVVISDFTTPGLFEVKRDGTVVTANQADFGVGRTPSTIQSTAQGHLLVKRQFREIARYQNGVAAGGAQPFATTSRDINAFDWGGPAGGQLYTFVATPTGRLETNNVEDGGVTRIAQADGAISAIVVDPAGSAYLYDSAQCSIRRVSPGGTIKQLIGGACSVGAVQEGRVGQGGGLALDPQGRLIFAETTNHRVLRIAIGTDDATTTTVLYENAAFNPVQLDVATDGVIFVVDDATKAVWKLE